MSAYHSLRLSRLVRPTQSCRRKLFLPFSSKLITSPANHLFQARFYSSHPFPPQPNSYPYQVTLGKISQEIGKPPENLELVPEFTNPLEKYLTSSDIRHLEWMVKKELMKQDLFLIGPPGGYKRRLVKLYGYVMSREMEMVQITRDTTEADIKQRREIRDKSVIYHDQVITYNL